MGKYIFYVFLILIILFALNFFDVVRIPFLDVPDFLSTKTEEVHKTTDTLKNLD